MCIIIGGLNIDDFIQKLAIAKVYWSPVFPLVQYICVYFLCLFNILVYLLLSVVLVVNIFNTTNTHILA